MNRRILTQKEKDYLNKKDKMYKESICGNTYFRNYEYNLIDKLKDKIMLEGIKKTCENRDI